MSNWTSRTLIVQVELLHSRSPYFVLLLPLKSAVFDWPLGNFYAGFCLGKIKWIEPDSTLLNNKSVIVNNTVTSNSKLLDIVENQNRLAELQEYLHQKYFLPYVLGSSVGQKSNLAYEVG